MSELVLLTVILGTGLLIIGGLFLYLKRMIVRNLEADKSPKTMKSLLIEKQIAELSELKEKNLIGEDEFKERAKRIFEKI